MKINVPKLRFIEFKDAPAWEEKKLGEVATVNDGTHQTPKYVDEGIPFYSVENITNNMYPKKFVSYEEYEFNSKRIKVEQGDIFVTRIGDIGTPKVYKSDEIADFYVSLALIKYNKCFDSEFLAQVIKSSKFQNELHKGTLHIAFPKKINLGEMKKCLLNLPSTEEQVQVGTFLSTLDRRIELQEKLIEKFEEEKKGYLQKLFPKKGKNIPELRFEEFKEAREWLSNVLSRLFEINNNGVDKKNFASDKEVNLLNFMDVYKKTIHTNMQTTATIQQLLSCSVLRNDLFITPSSETAYDILNAFCIEEELNNFVFSYHICRLRPIVPVSSKFVEYNLNTDISRKEAAKLSSGITRFTLSKKVIEEFSIKLPNEEEQECISNFLKKIDKGIYLQLKKLEEMKVQKKAILDLILI